MQQIGHHLFRNNATYPLFHKVIIESGASTARACYTYSNPLHEDQFAEFLKYLGLEDVPSEKVIRTLQTYSMQEIKSASDYIFKKYDPSVRWPFRELIGPLECFVRLLLDHVSSFACTLETSQKVSFAHYSSTLKTC